MCAARVLACCVRKLLPDPHALASAGAPALQCLDACLMAEE